MPWRHMIFPGIVSPPPLQQQVVQKKAQEHELALPEAMEQLKSSKAAASTTPCKHRLCNHLAPNDLCFREDADAAEACSSG